MAKNVNILLFVNTGTVEIPTWTVVGGQRNATLAEETETIDTTTKDSDGYFEYEYGLGGWTIECDGLYIPDDTGYTALKTAQRNKQKIKVQIKEDGQATEEGFCLVTSREFESPYDGESTYSVSLQGTGKLTPAV